jgi:hypothetical protein
LRGKENRRHWNQTSRVGHITRAKGRWSYDVTVENKTFKDLSELEMKYVIFFKQGKTRRARCGRVSEAERQPNNRFA